MILVRELMSPIATSARPDEPLAVAASRMRDNGHSCAVVCDGEGLLVGLVSERTLAAEATRMLCGERPRELSVADVMSRRPVCVSPEARLYQALVLTRERGVRHLPVAEASGRVLGMVTQTDLVSAYISILNRQDELASRNQDLQLQSLLDPLLQVGNRRAMDRDLARAQQLLDGGECLALALVDIDYFKSYNDHYGHLAGDQVLVRVTEAIRRSLRLQDNLYRFGGEELLVMLRNVQPEGLPALLERARAAVAALDIEHTRSPLGRVSISLGAARPAANVQLMLDEADRALYGAKAQGRDRLVCGAPGGETAPAH